MIPWEQRLARVLSALRLDSIRNKLTALVLVAVLVPTFTTAGASYLQNKRSLTDKVKEELQSSGSHTGRELGLTIRQAFYDIGVISSSFEVTENLELMATSGSRRSEAESRLQEYVTAVQERLTDYQTLRVLDSSGDLIVSSDGLSGHLDLPDEWQIALRADRIQMGEPDWNDTHNAVVATLAKPVSSAITDNYLGALVAELDFKAVSDLLSQYSPGASGKAYLVSADGRVITSSEGASSSTNAQIQSSVMEALAESSDRALEYEDLHGRTVLGTMHQLGDPDWSVIAEVDRAEAYAPIAKLRNVTMLLVGALLALIGGVAYLLGLFIVRPLARLTAGAAEVAGGDLSVDLPISGGGELADLTVVFNHMVQRLREGREQLERLSVTDGLTGLTNCRRGMEALQDAIQSAESRDGTVGLLMIDVDHFKQYNDTHGHLEGDEVLKGVSRAIQDAVGEQHVSCRYGGEEFMIVLHDSDAQGTVETARRIQERLAGEVFKGGRVTMSYGAAVSPPQESTSKDLIGAADRALYQAKADGRDRIVLAGDPEVAPLVETRKPKSSRQRKDPALVD